MPKPSPWGKEIESPDIKKFLRDLAKRLNTVDDKWVKEAGTLEEFLEQYSNRFSDTETKKLDEFLANIVQAQHLHAEIVMKIGRYLGE